MMTKQPTAPQHCWASQQWHPTTNSETCPEWYAQLQREEDRRYWDGLMGEGFNAWYLENVVESAKETTPSLPSPPPAVQLYLPGLSPVNSFRLESF